MHFKPLVWTHIFKCDLQLIQTKGLNPGFPGYYCKLTLNPETTEYLEATSVTTPYTEVALG